MGKKTNITENKISEIVDGVLNEFKERQNKETVNEGNSYKVDFNKLEPPKGQKRQGFWRGRYVDNKKTKDAMANGTYGKSGTIDMGLFLDDLKDLGYTPEQIQQGLNNGAITLADKRGNQWNARRQNRKFGRLMTKAGGVLGTGQTTDTQHHLVRDPETAPSPAPETTTDTAQPQTVYFQSDKIRQVQELLNTKFQAGLVVDGKCGDKTATAMLNALNQMGGQENSVPPVAEPVKRDTSNAIPKVNTNTTGTAQTNSNEMPSQLPSTKYNDYVNNLTAIKNNSNMTPQQKQATISRTIAEILNSGELNNNEKKQLRATADRYMKEMTSGQPLQESKALTSVFDIMDRMNNVEF